MNNNALYRAALFSFSLMFTFGTAKCADDRVKSDETNEAIEVLSSLQERSRQYPRAKLRIECKVKHSTNPLNANRELSYRILFDEPRFLCISTDSRPGQPDLPYQRDSVSFDGRVLRVLPTHVTASGKDHLVASEEPATGSLRELASANAMELGDVILPELLGYSNRSTAKLTVGLLSYQDYLSKLIDMVNSGDVIHSTFLKEDAGNNTANVLVITTAPNAKRRPGQRAVRHEIHMSPVYHRPMKLMMISALKAEHFLDNSERNLRETTVQWKEVAPGTILPEQINYREVEKGQIVYEETTTVIAEKVFGLEPIPDEEFDWVQLEPAAGQAAMFPGDEILRVWDGTSFAHNRFEEVDATMIPGNINWLSSWWFFANLIVFSAVMIVLARRVFWQSP